MPVLLSSFQLIYWLTQSQVLTHTTQTQHTHTQTTHTQTAHTFLPHVSRSWIFYGFVELTIHVQSTSGLHLVWTFRQWKTLHSADSLRGLAPWILLRIEPPIQQPISSWCSNRGNCWWENLQDNRSEKCYNWCLYQAGFLYNWFLNHNEELHGFLYNKLIILNYKLSTSNNQLLLYYYGLITIITIINDNSIVSCRFSNSTEIHRTWMAAYSPVPPPPALNLLAAAKRAQRPKGGGNHVPFVRVVLRSHPTNSSWWFMNG